MSNFFQPKPQNIIQPYTFMDLDDTLFQTLRKMHTWHMETENLVCSVVDKSDNPLSFFNQKQANYFNWLLHTTELIPVTARDSHEIKRVKLPFYSWKILTHGAIIVQPNGECLASWQQHIQSKLQSLQTKLIHIFQQIQQIKQKHNLLLKLTQHQENFNNDTLNIYLSIKHQHKNHQALQDFIKYFIDSYPNFHHDFYYHINANNLAILPHAIHKQHAVKFLLNHYLDKHRPNFGFGDSLADLPFLQLLDWYGTPCRGQLHQTIQKNVLGHV